MGVVTWIGLGMFCKNVGFAISCSVDTETETGTLLPGSEAGHPERYERFVNIKSFNIVFLFPFLIWSLNLDAGMLLFYSFGMSNLNKMMIVLSVVVQIIFPQKNDLPFPNRALYTHTCVQP